jgi:hypothetical protein
LTLPSSLLDHLIVLTDDTGVIQHATYDVPNRSTGYCTDDVTRGFLVAIAAAQHEELRDEALRLANIYIAFLHDAQLEGGRFRNFMGYDRRWIEEVGSEDAAGRAVWALGFGLRHAPRAGWRALCGDMLQRSLAAVSEFEYLRPRAYAAIGLSHAYEVPGMQVALRPALRAVASDLQHRYEATRAPDWEWFADAMLYDNARLCEATLRAGMALEDRSALAVGLETLDFLESVVFEDGRFVPIGNRGWYVRGGPRARFDQQPLEAAAMVDAELAAYAATREARRLENANLAFEWFVGRNSLGATLVRGGGCCDGLSEDAVNQNMGAESTLAYLAAALALAEARRPVASK